MMEGLHNILTAQNGQLMVKGYCKPERGRNSPVVTRTLVANGAMAAAGDLIATILADLEFEDETANLTNAENIVVLNPDEHSTDVMNRTLRGIGVEVSVATQTPASGTDLNEHSIQAEQVERALLNALYLRGVNSPGSSSRWLDETPLADYLVPTDSAGGGFPLEHPVKLESKESLEVFGTADAQQSWVSSAKTPQIQAFDGTTYDVYIAIKCVFGEPGVVGGCGCKK